MLGLVTATISVIVGFIFAYVTTYMKIRFKKIFDFIAILPIISPPFVVALSAILLFGRVGLITRGALRDKGCRDLRFSRSGPGPGSQLLSHSLHDAGCAASAD